MAAGEIIRRPAPRAQTSDIEAMYGDMGLSKIIKVGRNAIIKAAWYQSAILQIVSFSS